MLHVAGYIYPLKVLSHFVPIIKYANIFLKSFYPFQSVGMGLTMWL